MIFLFDDWQRRRMRKVEKWREEGRKWVEERNRRSDYEIYNFHDYQMGHEYPLYKLGNIFGTIGIVLGGLAVVAGIITIAIITTPPRKIDPNNPHDCSVAVKKGDKVGVIAGDFDGSKGVVVEQREDCSVNLTLTESSYTFESCTKTSSKGYCTETKENGEVLNVDRSTNIFKL